jgi:DNA primase
MSDFLSEFISDNPVIEREVTIRGRSGPAFFRRITAGERADLVKGQKVNTAGGSTTVEIDVGESVKAQHLLVHFSVCNVDGSRRFKTLREVQGAPSDVVAALYAVASEVNREDGETGKG